MVLGNCQTDLLYFLASNTRRCSSSKPLSEKACVVVTVILYLYASYHMADQCLSVLARRGMLFLENNLMASLLV